jgi:hypothetical protein
LGLIAVGTWQDFTDADAKVSKEAAALGALYRDLDGYPPEFREGVQEQLRNYVKLVIQKEWPAHRQGLILEDGDLLLEEFENAVMSFDPATEKLRIAHAESSKVCEKFPRIEAIGCRRSARPCQECFGRSF